MKLEDLKVGQYIRTKFGIKQIYEIDEHKTKWKYLYKLKKQDGDECIDLGVLSSEDIIKASFNIIDLIEVGDYVNGYKVKEVNNNLNKHKGICNCLDTYLYCVNDLDKFEEIVIFENEIKSIVTHEQMEQMAYKVGDK